MTANDYLDKYHQTRAGTEGGGVREERDRQRQKDKEIRRYIERRTEKEGETGKGRGDIYI